MIRGWMTFPSVIIPTPSHLHPLLAHKHTLACARVRQDADSLGGARISAQPGDKGLPVADPDQANNRGDRGVRSSIGPSLTIEVARC